jgi:glycine/D-amino acid oxidase-like deaminating enzyme
MIRVLGAGIVGCSTAYQLGSAVRLQRCLDEARSESRSAS